MDAAVVVVTHNSGRELLQCLASVFEAPEPVHVVVVDNASTEGSLDEAAKAYTGMTIVRNTRNVGFGAAANQGVRETSAECVLLLNPDAALRPGALGTLLEAMRDRPLAAAVGPLVRNPDGSVQPSKRAFPSLWESAMHGILGIVWPSNPGSKAYLLADQPLDRPALVGWVSGCATMLRRRAFDAVGGFDEDFFFFVEDADLYRRLSDAGWEIWFEPRAEVVHAWGTSWTRRPIKFLWMHHRNLWRYVRKHRRGAWMVTYPAVAAGLAVRFCLLALRYLVTRRAVPAHRSSSREVRS